MRHVILLIAAFLQFTFSFAGSGVAIHPQPGWIIQTGLDATRTPNPKSISNGFYVELSDRQVNLTTQTEYLHYIRRIVNESGVQAASEVTVEYAPQYQQVIFHQVAVIRNGKMMNQLSGASIKTADVDEAGSNYSYYGKKRAYIILKDVQKGDRVEAAYSVIGFNPVFKNRYTDFFYFYNPSPVVAFSLSVLTKPGTAIHIKTFNHAAVPVQKNIGPYTVYQWTNPYIDSSGSTSNTPSWFNTIPYVYVSEFADWKSVNDWGLLIFNHYQYPLPAKLLAQIANWHKISGGDQDRFINLALRFVQNQIRYLALELGTNTHQPHPPADVYNHRYGDCKDKSLLLTMILRQENIEAWVALANTDEREKLDSAATTPVAFNHAILAISKPNGYQFVDPTIAFQRGELKDNDMPAYGRALVIRPGTTALTKIDVSHKGSSTITEDLRISLEDTTLLEVTSIYSGLDADDQRSELSESSSSEIQSSYLKYYRSLYEGIQTDSAIQVEDDSLANIIQVREFYKIPKLWVDKDSSKIEFDAYAKIVADKFPNPDQLKNGEPMSIRFPCTLDYVLRLHFPEEWGMDIKELHIRNDAYEFDFVPISSGKNETFKYHFKSIRDFVDARDIARYKADYSEIQKCLSLWFSKGKSENGDQIKPVSSQWTFNPVTGWICFAVGLLLTMLFNFLNKIPANSGNAGNDPARYRGWTIVLGISLIIRLMVDGYNFINNGYLSHAVWEQMHVAGGRNLQALLVFEMFATIFSFVGAGMLAYWFFRKRDIFPNMFMYYTAIIIVVQFALVTTNAYLHHRVGMKLVQENAITQLFRSIVYGTVWISYLKKSENVQRTFVNSQ